MDGSEQEKEAARAKAEELAARVEELTHVRVCVVVCIVL